MDVSRRPGRTVLLVAASLVALLAVTGTGFAGLSAQEAEDDLMARLTAIEGDLPDLPPRRVVVPDGATWAQFPGNYRAVSLAFEDVADPLQRLFEDASASQAALADSVADATRGLLVLRQAYGLLARWEEADLEFPLERADEQRTATGADARYGTAEVGFRMLLDANQRRLAALRTLLDSEALTDDERDILSRRLVTLEEFDRDVASELRRALSLETAHEVVPRERFETSAPGMEARARSLTLSCVAHEAAGSGDPGAAGSDLRQFDDRSLPGDCPTLSGAEVRPAGGR